MISKEQFFKMWEGCTREQILNQYYYDYNYLIFLKSESNKYY